MEQRTRSTERNNLELGGLAGSRGVSVNPSSAAATAAAQQLWAQALADAGARADVVSVADEVCDQLRVALGRWIGEEGHRALLNRARRVVQAEHPALAVFSCFQADESPAVGVQARGADEVSAALLALVATQIELLGMIIGEQLTVRLVEQMARPRGLASITTQAARDG